MKRHKGIALLILLVTAGTLYAVRAGTSGAATPEAGTIQQAVASLGSLTVSTSGAGALVARTETDLGFQESGVIVEMNVSAGSQVKAGDLLARLQVDETPDELAAEIASAELAKIEAGQSLEALYDNASLKAAQALRALEEAQQSLEALKDDASEQAAAEQAVAEAQQAVADAEMQVYILTTGPSQEALDTSHASLLFKEKELNETKKQIARLKNQIKSAPTKMIQKMLKQQLMEMNIKLAEQQADYDNRLYRYNHMTDPADPVELSVAQANLGTAQAQLLQAQQDLEEIQAGATPADLAQAEADVAEAQATWERWKDGPDPDELAQAKAQLAAALAQLASVKDKQLILDLVAPYDGTVLSTTAVQGDRISGGTVLTLADVSQPLVEVSLDESDLSFLQVGNKAVVVFDAYPDSSFAGQVVGVDPGLADVDGAMAARGLVLLDEVPETPSFPVGLDATVDITGGQVENAVLVPVEAVHETSAGESAVYVIQGDQVEERAVTIGLSDYTMVEIKGGLAAGEAVALGNIPSLKGEQ